MAFGRDHVFALVHDRLVPAQRHQDRRTEFHSKNALFDQIGVAAFIAETVATAVMLTLLFEHYSFAVQSRSC